LARRDRKGLGDGQAKRRIRLSCSGHGTHPHLEHGAAVGAPFGPFDRIAAAARRQPHVDDDAIGCRRPWLASHGGQ
jgi:hypothetical protein